MKRLLFTLTLFGSFTFTNAFAACSDSLSDRSSAQLKIEKARVGAIIGITCGGAGVGVGLIDFFTGAIETIPLIGGVFTLIELQDVKDVDNMQIVTNGLGGSLLGSAVNDVIAGPIRLAGDFVISGFDGKYVRNFEYFRSFKSIYPAAREQHKQVVQELITDKSSSCKEYRVELQCINDEQDKRSTLAVASFDTELPKEIEHNEQLKNTNSVQIQREI